MNNQEYLLYDVMFKITVVIILFLMGMELLV